MMYVSENMDIGDRECCQFFVEAGFSTDSDKEHYSFSRVFTNLTCTKTLLNFPQSSIGLLSRSPEQCKTSQQHFSIND